MTLSFRAFLAPLALAAAFVVLDATSAAAQRIWSGRSGGFEIAWTRDDITARRLRDGALVFSAKRIVEHPWGEDGAETDEGPIEGEHRYRLLSVVGSVISLEEYSYCDCNGAHPVSSRGFAAYDLAESTLDDPAAARILDVVPEAALMEALLADRVIRRGLDEAGGEAPRTLPELVHRLNREDIEVGDDGCTYGVTDAFPGAFALHHAEGGRVAVRFGLGHWVELCRGKMVQVGVLVPVRPRFQEAVQAADARRAGFLMKDARRIGGEAVTTIEFGGNAR